MRGLLLLFSALLLLESTVGDKEYHQLSQYETYIIDRAIEEANERYGRTKHLDFASIKSANYDKRMLNVLLKPTSCKKTKVFVHRKDCKIQDEARPRVSCVACRGKMSCLPLREKTKIEQTIFECLRHRHYIGENHPVSLLAGNEQETENYQQPECLECA
ncbi:cystatin-like protein [Megalobrama amblycephala]|uniref:cystatin-like protein n=1 Tax=Megalobrama amblycephala TaxID=75352 RepID=UPI002014064A|nr:cystatin-like protein [Megalobrama amblycephala]